jgi:hypothetical protein
MQQLRPAQEYKADPATGRRTLVQENPTITYHQAGDKAYIWQNGQFFIGNKPISATEVPAAFRERIANRPERPTVTGPVTIKSCKFCDFTYRSDQETEHKDKHIQDLLRQPMPEEEAEPEAEEPLPDPPLAALVEPPKAPRPRIKRRRRKVKRRIARGNGHTNE